ARCGSTAPRRQSPPGLLMSGATAVRRLLTSVTGAGHGGQPQKITLGREFCFCRVKATDGNSLFLVGHENPRPFGAVMAILGAAIDAAILVPFQIERVDFGHGDPAAIKVEVTLILSVGSDA